MHPEQKKYIINASHSPRADVSESNLAVAPPPSLRPALDVAPTTRARAIGLRH